MAKPQKGNWMRHIHPIHKAEPARQKVQKNIFVVMASRDMNYSPIPWKKAHPRIGRHRVQAMGWSRYGHHTVLCSGNQRL